MRVWNAAGADATDVAVWLKYAKTEAPPLKDPPFRIAHLGSGEPPVPIGILFLPEVGGWLKATISYTDRAGRHTIERDLRWGPMRYP